MEDLEFKVDMKTKYMYIFQLRHSYLCISGVIGILVSVAMIVLLCMNYDTNTDAQNVILVIGAALFTIIHPWNLFSRSVKMVKLTPVFQKPLNYKFDNEGITISQSDDSALLPWKDVTSVIETSSTIYIYTSPKNGYIMPKEQYADKVNQVKELINKSVDKEKCKLKLKMN